MLKAEITLSVSEAFAAEAVSITGVGFPPKSRPSSITFTAFPSTQLIYDSPLPATDEIGNISIDVKVPWPGRTGDVIVVIGGVEANARLLIRLPNIVATRQDASTVLVVGEGFPPSSQTNVSIDIVVRQGPNIFSDENGNISFELTTFGETKTPDGIVHVSVGEFNASSQIN